MKSFVIRWGVTTAALFVASQIVPEGIFAETPGALVWAGLWLAILNAVVRPVLLFLSLPLVVLSFGLMIPLINALLLRWVGGGGITGFHVAGFGPAFVGALVVSFVSWAFHRLSAPPRSRFQVRVQSFQGMPSASEPQPGEMKRVEGRVIEHDHP
ncbi:MAG: phage holin family protein [Chthoniobacteraceae bacterium]|nr:phage holin family protein [Chthoniobacteraceae bacterium]